LPIPAPSRLLVPEFQEKSRISEIGDADSEAKLSPSPSSEFQNGDPNKKKAPCDRRDVRSQGVHQI
jgi:hypothetical protein